MHEDGDLAEGGNDMHGLWQKTVIWQKKEKSVIKTQRMTMTHEKTECRALDKNNKEYNV